MAKRQGTKG